MRARDCGLITGGEPGPKNAITDVAGVRVGHRTIRDGDRHTGVTAIIPHGGDLFRDKPCAAVDVINGFGKSVGLMQVEELGRLETPILLTNTFSVPECAAALIREAIAANPGIGRETATVNPLVFECNDGPLNDIQAMAVTAADVLAALSAAREGLVEEGSVGAGAGMSSFGFKSGIGTASRRIELGGEARTLGVLVLSNFGRAGDLVLPDGRRPKPPAEPMPDETEKGSIITIVATDVPMEHRQLRRVARRAGAGVARLGAFWGHGSGDIALAFSTATRFAHEEPRDVVPTAVINEARIDRMFSACAEATQEAVLNALCAAGPFRGRGGLLRTGLRQWIEAHAGRA